VPQRLVPFLGYEDPAAAIDWICAVFGATEDSGVRRTDADGTVVHAELDIVDLDEEPVDHPRVVVHPAFLHGRGPRRPQLDVRSAAPRLA
jgi:hypothetical protein